MRELLNDNLNPRDRIIHATLKIIGDEGFHKVTVRKIACIADVNLAAINYYFGSKDNVINEALKYFTSKFVNCFAILDNIELPPIDRMRNFLISYSDACVEYPDIFRNFICQIIYNDDIPFEYVEFIKQQGFKKVRSTLMELTDIKDDNELCMTAAQVISCLIFPVLLGRQMKSFSDLNYEDKNIRSEYVELLLKKTLIR